MMSEVVDNYRKIEQRVHEACKRAGRNPAEVTLVAVSKTKPDEMVRELAATGVRDFGENKPQELLRKHDGITDWEGKKPEDKLSWHMIGNIQTNKVKMFVGRACLIHSVPDLHVAEAISKEAVKQGVTARILIEVNIAGEETKHGLAADDTYGALKELAEEIARLSNIEVCGLMAIAPPVENPEDNRLYFRQMKQLRDKLMSENLKNASLTELSMGMTGDFEVAIEEGATIVRVGTAIFGARDYSV